MKNIFKIFICFLFLFLVVGCSSNVKEQENNNNKNITIVIIDNNKKELYNKNVRTSFDKLVDVLNDKKISLVIDDGPYGAYITSLMDLKQKDTEDGMYYWSYYIDDKYAEVGISNCKIKDGSIYKFVYEYYKK